MICLVIDVMIEFSVGHLSSVRAQDPSPSWRIWSLLGTVRTDVFLELNTNKDQFKLLKQTANAVVLPGLENKRPQTQPEIMILPTMVWSRGGTSLFPYIKKHWRNNNGNVDYWNTECNHECGFDYSLYFSPLLSPTKHQSHLVFV